MNRIWEKKKQINLFVESQNILLIWSILFIIQYGKIKKKKKKKHNKKENKTKQRKYFSNTFSKEGVWSCTRKRLHRCITQI